MSKAPTLVVEHALVCEDVRREQGGKTSVLGLFGFSPHVKIEVAKVGAGFLPRLAFLFFTAPVAEDTHITGIDAAFGPVALESDLTFTKMENMNLKAGHVSQLLIQIVNPPMPRFGRYVAVVREHGRTFGRAEFELRQRQKTEQE